MTSSPVSSTLVGRAGDVSALLDALGDAGTHTVLISGEAGLGKSRLVDEFTRRLDRNTLVLVGRCPELGTDGMAFAPFTTVLRGIARQLGVEALAELLPPRPALANWLPALAVHTGAAAPGADRIRLFGEFLTVLEQLAMTRPLVLVLEDLHWADGASRDLLAFLVTNLVDGDALLVGTYRPGDAGPLRGLLAELRRNPGVRTLDLRPLTRHEVGRQLAALLGREPESTLITRIFERSGGNPLFVEALGLSPEEIPAGLTDLLLSFHSGLSVDARTVLRAATVIGSTVRHELLAATVELSADQLHAALRELVERHLILPADTGYEFRHALIRQAGYDDLLPAERTGLHARVVRALRASDQTLPRDTAEHHASELAHHAAAAGDFEQALTSSWQAAAATATDAERLRQLERVHDYWDRVPHASELLSATKLDVLEGIVEAALNSGATERGTSAADAALARMNDAGFSAPARIGNSTRALVTSAGVGGGELPGAVAGVGGGESPAGADSVAAQGVQNPASDGAKDFSLGVSARAGSTAAEEVSSADASGIDPARVARLYRWRAGLRGLAGAGPGDDLDRALELLAGEPASIERAEVLTQVAISRIFSGDDAGGGAAAGGALEIAREFGAARLVARCHAFLGLASAAQNEVAAGHFAAAREVAESLGDPQVLVEVATWESAVLVAAGRYREAIAVIQSGLRAAHTGFRFAESAPILLVKWAQALTALGRWGEVRALVDEAEFEQMPSLSRAALLLSYARIALAQGDASAARADLGTAEQLLGPSSWAGAYRLQLHSLRGLLALEHGNADEAAALLADLCAENSTTALFSAYPSETWPVVDLALRVPGAPAELRGLADSLPATTAVDAAHHAVCAARAAGTAALWERAALAWRALEQPYEEAESLFAAAEAHVSEGTRDAAVAALRTVVESAAELGAEPLTAAAEQVAKRARLPIGAAAGTPAGDASSNARPSGAGHYGLTPRELDVLRLVAKGMSNRALAAELFISANTAGVHVSRILTKLGVASRTEAAAFAHAHNLLG
ncbi:helix-turn-helix transcriptional regulator [Nocardia sp. NPDC127526]|uniref:helix-turn-helix transcriptional regulator n=1 Tax=Nocardia sp. NPDC127526 TaxID=3345393 RepID=UPI00362D0C90